jgi:hypothetical protein
MEDIQNMSQKVAIMFMKNYFRKFGGIFWGQPCCSISPNMPTDIEKIATD